MNQAQELDLRGCTPEPLMAYLKALGIFRIVAEQRDNESRAFWHNDAFFLRSQLDREALVRFFLEEYRPTPIISPWNGGSGFYRKDNPEAKNAILEAESPKFDLWRDTISISNRLVDPDWSKKERDANKEWVLAQCRTQFPDEALDWLDAAYVLTADGARYPPLLGTGGNDGRLDFSNNFMQSVVLALNLDQRRNGDVITRNQIVAALFNEGSPELARKRSTGFYNPGSVGGANSSVGFNDDSMTNPWDYVLMFEGALLFAGAAARRMSPQSSSKAVFPFTVDNTAAGYGTSVDSEYGGSARAEFWAPLWDQPANLNELTHLASEGRAQLGRRQVSNGTNFARAVAGLGTERGVSQFQRYGFLERNGMAFLAAPLGRFYVQDKQDVTQAANVLFDLDQWLESLRRAATGRTAPAGLGTALRQVEQAIIEFCQRGQPRDLQNVLLAMGQAERWLATSSLRSGQYPVRPLNFLSHQWLRHADDRTAEFRLARAVASILPGQQDGQGLSGAIRENLEPVKAEARRRTEWQDDSTTFVWNAGDPLSNMMTVLERRCLESRMAGLQHPALDSSHFASLDHVVEFLHGGVDERRMTELVLPLSFVRHRPLRARESPQQKTPVALPAAYAVMKLTLLPAVFNCPAFDIPDTDIWMEPTMIAMLRAGRIGEAYRVAVRRLRASGLPQTLSDTPGIADGSERGRRLAAALLFPLGPAAYNALSELAFRRPGLGNGTDLPSSEQPD